MTKATMIAGLIAFWLVGCGGAPPAGTPGAPTPVPTTTPAVVSQECGDYLTAFHETLNEVDARLGTGLNKGDYSTRVGDVSVASSRVTTARLIEMGELCVRTGLLLMEAFGEYDLANVRWGECFQETGCTNQSVLPELQRRWSVATSKIAQAHRVLP